MRFVEIKSFQYQGLEKREVVVQALKTRGLSQLSLSGNISPRLRDASDKVKAVVTQSTAWGPVDKVLVHFLPADFVKSSSQLELPLAVAIRAVLCSDELTGGQRERLEKFALEGILTLTGEIHEGCVTEFASGEEYSFQHFEELWDFLLNNSSTPRKIIKRQNFWELQCVEAQGRSWEKLWLLVASVCRQPVLLMGPPGVGKTHLAKWAARLLPEADELQRQEIDRIWTLAGSRDFPRVPFQSPHSRTHLSEFVGLSRQEQNRPGIFSLAHGGLLVLDEFAELARDCREILRNILDEREVRRNNKSGLVSWPADFWLLLTANPCPCGLAEGRDLSRCRCTEGTRLKYLTRFSGPLLDRVAVKLFLSQRALPELRGDDHLLASLPLEELLGDRARLHGLITSARRNLDENARGFADLHLDDYRLSPREKFIYKNLWAALHGLFPGADLSEIFLSFLRTQKNFQKEWMGRSYELSA